MEARSQENLAIRDLAKNRALLFCSVGSSGYIYGFLFSQRSVYVKEKRVHFLTTLHSYKISCLWLLPLPRLRCILKEFKLSHG